MVFPIDPRLRNCAYSHMKIADQVRRIYEQRPYPFVAAGARRPVRWQMAPMEWITAMWQPSQPMPRRILVAGCGTGVEAFALARKFPWAEITGVDFSPRSIDLARELHGQECPARKIRFLVGDLASPKFANEVGLGFDLITCHGVLSYIPKPVRVLRNFARCLAPDGALYLGVNGSTHFSVAWRRALPAFGFGLDRFEDGARPRRKIRLFDVLSGHPAGMIARKDAAFLASDLFSSFNQTLPLADWTRLCGMAGLNLRGSYAAYDAIRQTLKDEGYEMLMPRSRAEVSELVDKLKPGAFHWLVYSPKPAENPPWDTETKLIEWRPRLTRLYSRSSLKKSRSRRSLHTLVFKSRPMNSLVELRVPEWELEILRRSDGASSLREILAPISPAVSRTMLRRQLYLLYQLMLLDLLPPVLRTAK